jgi:hypothetical protein
MFLGPLAACTFLILVHMLETIRNGLTNIDKVKDHAPVTDLSVVLPLSDSQVDNIEMERVSRPSAGN